MADKVVVRNLSKVFGARPAQAMDMLRQGRTKEQIFRHTGMVVGVQDASFAVEEGEIFVLMGLSGSGKSTLIRLLNRLVEPTHGQVLVGGHDVAALGRRALVDLRRRDMAMVFQSFALLPHRTVLDNTAFGLEVAGMARAPRERRALEVLAQVGLEAFAARKPAELSGGMQQRVGLARALAVDPSLMLMDEAFSALDPLRRTEMQDLLLALQKEQRRTIVFVSHDLDEAFRIGNRIAIMEGGRIVQIGTPDEILRNPADAYVRAFFQGVDIQQYLVARDLADADLLPVLHPTDDGRGDLTRASAQMQAEGAHQAVLVEQGGRLLGTLTSASVALALASGRTALLSALVPEGAAARASLPLRDVVAMIVQSPLALPVVDEAGNYLGAVSQTQLLRRYAADRGATATATAPQSEALAHG